MASYPVVQVDGIEAAIKTIEQCKRAAARKEVEDAIALVAARVIVPDAQSRIHSISGDLAASLHVGGYTHLTPGFRGKAYDRLKQSAGKSRAVIVGSKVPYSWLVEKGRKGASARPYMRPAIDSHTGEVAKAVDEALQRIFDAA